MIKTIHAVRSRTWWLLGFACATVFGAWSDAQQWAQARYGIKVVNPTPTNPDVKPAPADARVSALIDYCVEPQTGAEVLAKQTVSDLSTGKVSVEAAVATLGGTGEPGLAAVDAASKSATDPAAKLKLDDAAAKLKLQKAAESKRAAELAEQLGSPDSAARDKASSELGTMSLFSMSTLQSLAEQYKNDPEIVSRLKQAADAIRQKPRKEAVAELKKLGEPAIQAVRSRMSSLGQQLMQNQTLLQKAKLSGDASAAETLTAQSNQLRASQGEVSKLMQELGPVQAVLDPPVIPNGLK